MPTIDDFSKVEFVPVYKMHLERPSIIVSGITGSGPFKQFKFYIDENTDIDDVIFVLRNQVDCTSDDVEFCTAGFGLKRREGHEKISDIYGPKQREGQAHRFKRRQMMQVSIWPRGWTTRQEARQAKMFNYPKIYGSPLEANPDPVKENAERAILEREKIAKIRALQIENIQKDKDKKAAAIRKERERLAEAAKSPQEKAADAAKKKAEKEAAAMEVEGQQTEKMASVKKEPASK